MNYGDLLEKAWDIVWKNKYMILLGLLVILGGAGGGGGSQGLSGGNGIDFSTPIQDVDFPVVPMIGIITVVVILLIIGVAVWVLGTISRGGLIFAANTINQGSGTTFNHSLQAGWEKGWRMIGIGVVPGIPVLLLVLLSIGSLGVYGGFGQIGSPGDLIQAPPTGLFLPVGVLACLLVPLTLVLILLRTFANRACMLEDKGVVAAYRRGVEVLGENFGSAIVLFLIQIAISFGIWLVMLVPGILIALCCFLWPIFLLFEGTIAAWYSSVWTLAWNRWTGVPDLVPPKASKKFKTAA